MKALLAAALLALFTQNSGKLEIKDVTEGKGQAAQAGDIVTVHYTGTLTNGKQFDSSVGKTPFTFILGAGQVIKGWDQGVVGMKPEGKRTLTIPSSLGYGDEGAGDVIPPKSTLKFEITMLSADRIETKILQEGKGTAKAKGGDTCELHYQLTDTEGKKIDSSYDRNQTFQIVLGKTGLIKGFTAGVIGMKQGEKRKLTIPAKFGYGDKGAGDRIPGGATLIFEVELVKLLSGEKK